MKYLPTIMSTVRWASVVCVTFLVFCYFFLPQYYGSRIHNMTVKVWVPKQMTVQYFGTPSFATDQKFSNMGFKDFKEMFGGKSVALSVNEHVPSITYYSEVGRLVVRAESPIFNEITANPDGTYVTSLVINQKGFANIRLGSELERNMWPLGLGVFFAIASGFVSWMGLWLMSVVLGIVIGGIYLIFSKNDDTSPEFDKAFFGLDRSKRKY